METPVDDLSLQETENEAAPAGTLVSTEETEQPSIDADTAPGDDVSEAADTHVDEPRPQLSAAEEEGDLSEIGAAITAETEDLAEQPSMPVAEPAVETRTETEKDEPEEAPLNDEAAVAAVENASEEAFLDEAAQPTLRKASSSIRIAGPCGLSGRSIPTGVSARFPRSSRPQSDRSPPTSAASASPSWRRGIISIPATRSANC